MSNNPVTNAFFFGRALAEVMSEKLEESFTSAMSDLGKFDAEQRENLRQFVEEVQLRAERAEGVLLTQPVTVIVIVPTKFLALLTLIPAALTRMISRQCSIN